MRVVSFLVLCGLAGLLFGYLIFGRFNGEFISIERLFTTSENIVGRTYNTLTGVNEARKSIIVSGCVGAIVGIFIGLLTRKFKKKVE